MSVKRFVETEFFLVVTHFEPFIPWIPTLPLPSRGISPYALAVVQHSEFFAYCLYWALGAVVLCLFPFEKRVLFKPISLHLFGEEKVGGNSFARCACLPVELARHMFNV